MEVPDGVDAEGNPKTKTVYYEEKHVRDISDVMARHPFTADQLERADTLRINFYDQFGSYFDESPDQYPVPPTADFFMWPAPDLPSVSSRFGWRIISVHEEFHYGVDLNFSGDGDLNKPVYASAFV